MNSPQEVIRWNDAHFCGLSSQSNIYGLQRLRTESNTYKFLVSSLHSSFLSVEYQKIGDKVTPLTRGIQFTHIPAAGDCEIVSINAFERLPPKTGLVVGITYIMVVTKVKESDGSDQRRRRSPQKEEFKDASKGPYYFNEIDTDLPQEQETKPKNQVLNIYTTDLSKEDGVDNSGKENKLEIVADNCESFGLTFIPFVLTHTEVVLEDGQEERIFLLSGSDFKMHVYLEQAGPKPSFMEVPSNIFFPEFEDLPTNALQVDFRKPDPQHRLTAVGFNNGLVSVHLVNVNKKEVIKQWTCAMDSPVTSLHFFTQRKIVPVPPCLKQILDDANHGAHTEEDPSLLHINLVMTTALQPAVVYRDVLTSGLSECLCLPGSEKYDTPLCSLAADVDFDGLHELIIGTYGQELLVYKFSPTVEKLVPVSPPGAVLPASPPGRTESDSSSTPSAKQADEPGKHRHKSDEGNTVEKSEAQQRKVKSQEDLQGLIGERGLDPGYIPERKNGDALEMRTVFEPHYEMLWQRSFPCPLMALDSAEMMGDGLENLVVLTSHGLHIMQPDHEEVADLIIHRLQQMVMSGQEEGDAFHKLQTE